ncbi:MAG: Ig-like domain-containing protein [Solobacterium sp.]|nr:Ig-like domain-containing protein [Solobacterium sp.]
MGNSFFRRLVKTLLAVFTGFLLCTPVQAYQTGDDYPEEWRGNPDKIDAYGFNCGNCTSFAAWCMDTRNHYRISNYELHLGDAKDWAENARKHGYRVDDQPAVGAIIKLFNAKHVAWVREVRDHTVVIEEYNYGFTYQWHEREIDASLGEYIHFKDIEEESEPEVLELTVDTAEDGMTSFQWTVLSGVREYTLNLEGPQLMEIAVNGTSYETKLAPGKYEAQVHGGNVVSEPVYFTVPEPPAEETPEEEAPLADGEYEISAEGEVVLSGFLHYLGNGFYEFLEAESGLYLATQSNGIVFEEKPTPFRLIPKPDGYTIYFENGASLTLTEDGLFAFGTEEGIDVFQFTAKEPSPFELDVDEIHLAAGESRRLEVLTGIEDGIVWRSEDETVAIVDETGLVTALAEGETWITASLDGREASFRVIVEKVLFEAETEEINLTVGEGEQLAVNTNLAGDILWTSEDEKIARVDETGYVTALWEGETVVTAALGEYTAVFHVTVASPLFVFSEEEATVAEGDSRQLEIETSLEGQIIWQSDDEETVTVDDNGVITGIHEGSTTVYAYLDMYMTSIHVTVEAPVFAMAEEETTLHLWEKFGLHVVTNLSGKIVWESTDEDVVTVDSTGWLSPVGSGKADVIASLKGYTAVCHVTIPAPVQGGASCQSVTLEPGDTWQLEEAEEYLSEDEKVAEVDEDGLVTAVGEGKTAIKADGKRVLDVRVLPAACRVFGFCTYGSRQYWYENGRRQAMPGDVKNITDTVYGTERGREIYDPESEGWYWLDCIFDGAKASDKEVWMPYIYQSDLESGKNTQGKWVRYDHSGKMIKGWLTIEGKFADLYPEQEGNTYYYDLITGEMVKGVKVIDGVKYHFNENTGVLERRKR